MKMTAGRGWLLDHLEYSYNRPENADSTIDVEYPAQGARTMLPNRIKIDVFGFGYDINFNSINTYKLNPHDFELEAFGLGGMKSPPKKSWLMGGGWLFVAAGLLILAAVAVRRFQRPRELFARS